MIDYLKLSPDNMSLKKGKLEVKCMDFGEQTEDMTTDASLINL